MVGNQDAVLDKALTGLAPSLRFSITRDVLQVRGDSA